MTKYSSNGEVYGSKMLTLAVIAVSAFVLAGTVYSTSQPVPRMVQPTTHQIVDTTHTATAANGVSG